MIYIYGLNNILENKLFTRDDIGKDFNMSEDKNLNNIDNDDNLEITEVKPDINEKNLEQEVDDTSTKSNKPSSYDDISSEDNISPEDDITIRKKKRRKIIIKSLRILFTIGFFVFLGLFINEILIQPYKLKKSIEKAQDLYHYVDVSPTNEPNEEIQESDTSDSSDDDTDIDPSLALDPDRDDMGRLRKFASLLEVNEDVKGWIRIDNVNGDNDTKIDYVVMQSGPSDPEYYLNRNWATHDYLKAGSLFLDYSSSVKNNSKNLIIHGHNMTSSDDMFHYLVDYQELQFLKEHPIISFDTIYEEGLWKVFSVYITPGGNDKGDFFPFVRSGFTSDRDYMEYIYQIRARSLFNIDDVDINENDQILTLSTCSYELSNYRTIVVARKVREGEEAYIDSDRIEKKKFSQTLYPESYYNHYGGKAPDMTSFDAALEDGLIPWYNPMGQ